MKILGTYQIHYLESNVVQVKNLIAQSDYENIIKPKLKEVYDLNLLGEKQKSSSIKKELKDTFGEHYFTNQSPLFKAIDTGLVILPEHQGLEYQVSLIKIENTHENNS